MKSLRKCFTCGEDFTTLDRRESRGKFCSKECYHTNKRKNYEGRPIAIPPLKLSVKKPDAMWKVAYLAGLIDGEGTISFRKNGYAQAQIQPYISVSNTDLEMLYFIQENFGGSIVKAGRGIGIDYRGITSHKQEYVWQVRSLLDVMLILSLVRYYLITKRSQAERVWDFCKTKYAQYSTLLINQEISSKAQRNAIRSLIPEHYIAACIEEFKKKGSTINPLKSDSKN